MCDFKAFLQKERAKAVSEARRILDTPGAVVVDTETTDLNGVVIELAIINLYGEVLYKSLFKPLEPISPKARAVHGISDDMLTDAPAFADEMPRIYEVLSVAPIICFYNADFDGFVLGKTIRKALKDACQESNKADWFALESAYTCLMELYAQYYGEWSEYHGSFTWQPLEGGDHTALGDARAALKLLREMASE